MTNTTETIERIAGESTELYAVAEALLRRLADGELLSFDDHAVFDRLGWSSDEVAKQTKRIATVTRTQSDAGTEAERRRAAEDADKAEDKLSKRGAEIRAKIAALQDEHHALEQDAAATRRASETRERAVQSLRELSILPAHIKRGYLHTRANAVAPIEQELNAITARVQRAKSFAAWSPDDQLQRVLIENVIDDDGRRPWRLGVDDRGRVMIDAEVWQSFVDGRLAEVPELEARAADLREQLAEAEAEVETLRNCYVP